MYVLGKNRALLSFILITPLPLLGIYLCTFVLATDCSFLVEVHYNLAWNSFFLEPTSRLK